MFPKPFRKGANREVVLSAEFKWVAWKADSTSNVTYGTDTNRVKFHWGFMTLTLTLLSSSPPMRLVGKTQRRPSSLFFV